MHINLFFGCPSVHSYEAFITGLEHAEGAKVVIQRPRIVTESTA